jgi:hypothetical protein
MQREDLIPAIERTCDEYSFAWEGVVEEVLELGDALVRLLPETVRGSDGSVNRIRFPADNLGERTREVMEQLDATHRNLRWMIGPSSPPGLEDRLIGAGLELSLQWHGMLLTDLSIPIPTNPNVQIEQLSHSNAEEYARLRSILDPGPNALDRHRGVIKRYLAVPQRRVLIYLARVEGQLVGIASLLIEPGGVAYLREAENLPDFRGLGVYRTMVAHRLAVARSAGCTGAVIQALVNTSAPILLRLGFEPVGRFVAYAAPGGLIE